MIMPYLIINTYVSLMYELKKKGKVFTSKFVGTGPSSYEKRIYRAAVSQRFGNAGLDHSQVFKVHELKTEKESSFWGFDVFCNA